MASVLEQHEGSFPYFAVRPALFHQVVDCLLKLHERRICQVPSISDTDAREACVELCTVVAE